MATGYVVSGAGDLDDLFQPRVSTAIANTSFLSNGGVDLAQRFEKRGDGTAIANTNFRSGATDLSALFLGLGNLADPILSSGNFVAGPKGGNTYRLDELLLNDISGSFLFVRISHATVTPANSDAVWQFLRCTGIFANSGGLSVTRNFARSVSGVTNTHTTPSGRPGRSWQTNTEVFRFVAGNTYSLLAIA
jgi:hypothetical protein